MNPNNILFMCREFPPVPHGGTGSVTYEMASLMQKMEKNVYINSQYCAKSFCHEDICKDYIGNNFYRFIQKIPLSFIDSIFYSRSTAKRTKEMIDKYNIDIIEAPSHGGEAFFYSMNKTTPLAIRLHGFLSRIPSSIDAVPVKAKRFYEDRNYNIIEDTINNINNKMLWEIEKKALLKADLLISPSQSMVDFIIREIPSLDRKKIELVYNGIDTDSISRAKKSENIKERFNINNGNLTICYAGRINRSKGIDTLIRAAALILKERKDITFILMGPIIDENLVTLCKQGLCKDYSRNIIFTQRIPRDAVISTLKASTLLVHPSMYEVLPTIIIEAMASKKPVIASDIPPHKELVFNGLNGNLFNVSDPRDLAEKILTAVSDPDGLIRMGNIGCKLARERFSIRRMVTDTLNAYGKAI